MLAKPNQAAIRGNGIVQKMGDLWILAVLLVMIAVFSIINPVFLTVDNWINTTTFMTDNLLLALAETIVILTAGIDLSVGANMGLSSIVCALILEYGMETGMSPALSIPLSIIGGLLTGSVVGLINGWVITKGRISPFIATLGMLGVCTGLTFIVSNGTSITNLPPEVGEIGNYVIGGVISFSVLITLIVTICIYLMLNQTRFGRHTYAIGSNMESAKRAGINVDKHLTKVYTLSGFLAALAGIIVTMRFVNGSPLTGSHTELNAIAAVVIGGTSLFGGRGTVGGTVIGSGIIAVLLTGLVLAHVQVYWQIVAIGAIIVLAVYMDQLRNKNK